MKNALALASLFVFSLVAPAAFAENLSVHGSTTFIAAILYPTKAAIEKDTGLTLDVVGNGSGNGLTDLAQGKPNG